MVSLVGHAALVGAALACGIAVAASLSGARADRRRSVDAGARALVAATLLLGFALAALAWALLTGDYSLEYVARATSRSMSWQYRLGSLWSGMEGSLLLWGWLLAVGSAAGIVARRRATDERATPAERLPEDLALRAWAQTVLAAVVGATTLVVLTLADPFSTLAFPALDGAGLTPILEHPALLYHPPILYLGQTLLAVPFAVTVAGLLQGQLGGSWLAVARRFALVAWLALTAGIVAGSHWAYQELGWGGLWAWDPVENASLLPWLATTAFLHSALVVERRRHLRAWTAGLALAAFALSLVGAYLTRSGAAGSVHAFAEARAIGFAFLVGVAAVVIGGGLLLSCRWRRLGPGWQLDGVTTREAALLANNAVLLAGLVVVAAGTLAPLASEALGGNEFGVAPRFFATLVALPALLALAFTGIAPALPWSRSRRIRAGTGLTAATGAALGAVGSVVLGLATPVVMVAATAGGATVALSAAQATRALASGAGRRTRALAAAVAHLGFALALLGIAGSSAGGEISGPFGPGEEMTLGRYRLVHEGIVERAGERRSSVRLQLGVFIGGDRVATLRPGLDTYHGPGGSGAPLPETALRSTPREDLLVSVVRIDVARGVAVVEVFRRPLVAWVWIGGILTIFGGALALRRPAGRRAAFASGESCDAQLLEEVDLAPGLREARAQRGADGEVDRPVVKPVVH